MIPGQPKTLHIAVVDDHESTRITICQLLERHGYSTCNFGSVQEFIHSHEKRVISCLISDVRMPGIDGISLQEVLQHTNFTFPIIFCTGQEVDERLNKALENGVFRLLRKPVASQALLDAVAAACASGSLSNKR